MNEDICTVVPIDRRDLGSGDTAIYKTLQIMAELTIKAMSDPLVRWHAEDAVAGVPPGDDQAEIDAVRAYLRARVTYRRDPQPVEWLQAPGWVIQCYLDKGRTAQLDCDDLSMLVAALLGSIGHRVAFRVISTLPTEEYNHVLVMVYPESGPPVRVDLTEAWLPDGFPQARETRADEVPLWEE